MASGPALLAAIILGACTAGSGGAATQPPRTSIPAPTPAPSASTPTPGPTLVLDGRAFLSTSVTEAGVDRPLVKGTRIRIGFEEGRLSASAGCNMMGATYTLDGATLKLGPGAVTEMGCDGPRHDQDDWLFTLLGASPILALMGETLTITSGTTVITLLDREVAEPDQPLTGHSWTLETIVNGDAASSVPVGVTATIEFTNDGTVLVDTGCNTGGGSYAVAAGTLKITGLATTKKACAGAATDVEQAVLEVLRSDSITYEIDASVLRLRTGDGGLDYRVGTDR